MTILRPDATTTLNGVKINEYLLTKHNPNRIDMPSVSMAGKIIGVTVHNTDWITVASGTTPAEQYTRATVNNNMKDVRVDTYHSSGAGGQNVNKTSSAVRMTHFPTGIVVACQTERDQVQNRATCLKMLKDRLLELRERAKEEEMANIKGEMKKIEWGSQIRSYVFQPYTMVKDHRTNYESGNIDDVMDGNLEGFITAYLKMQ